MTRADLNTSRFDVPRGWTVRYDLHDHPRGVSAITLDGINRVRSVGFAKFNPRDEAFSVQTGKRIALGRALAKLPHHLTRPRRPVEFGRAIGRDLQEAEAHARAVERALQLTD